MNTRTEVGDKIYATLYLEDLWEYNFNITDLHMIIFRESICVPPPLSMDSNYPIVYAADNVSSCLMVNCEEITEYW